MNEHVQHMHSTCAAQVTTISNIKDTAEIYNSEIKDICSINRDIQEYIDSCHKESRRRAADLEQITAHLNPLRVLP